MKDETFVDMVKKYFGYVVSEYNFQIAFVSNSALRPRTDGLVKYKSDTTLIIVDSEQGQVAVRFLRIQDDERYYVDPVSIHEYLHTSEQEKQILLSKDISDQPAASTIFSKRFLLSSPNWRGRENADIDLERQLKNYASWMKENASLCLTGDFSRWPEFYEYKINRLMADEIRRGGKEEVLAVVKDENGALKTIKRPIFQREREHLTRLRKEILNQ